MSLDSVLKEQKTLEEERKQTERKAIPPPVPKRHAIGFSYFFPELIGQEKIATTRQPRQIKKGELLSLHWEPHTDISLKPCNWLYDARVIEVIPWTLPSSPRSIEWEDIYRYTLHRDCFWVDDHGEGLRGWTSREAYQKLYDWYGAEAVLETIRYKPEGALPSPREVLLSKRLYYALLLGKEQYQKEHRAKEEQKARSWFSPDSMKKKPQTLLDQAAAQDLKKLLPPEEEG